MYQDYVIGALGYILTRQSRDTILFGDASNPTRTGQHITNVMIIFQKMVVMDIFVF
jgi:hypothetical protein